MKIKLLPAKISKDINIDSIVDEYMDAEILEIAEEIRKLRVMLLLSDSIIEVDEVEENGRVCICDAWFHYYEYQEVGNDEKLINGIIHEGNTQFGMFQGFYYPDLTSESGVSYYHNCKIDLLNPTGLRANHSKLLIERGMAFVNEDDAVNVFKTLCR